MAPRCIKIDYYKVLLLLFSFVYVFFCSKCSPLYFFNEWCDPHIYFSVGKGMFNGKVLYRDVFDHKGPLIFFIFGIGYLVSNTNFLGIYFLESISLFISILYIYKIGILFLRRDMALLLPLIYAVLLFSRSGTGGSADEFLVPFVTVSFYYFIRFYKIGDNSNLYKQFFIHGIMFSCVFFIKYTACLLWPPILLGILYKVFRQEGSKRTLVASLYFLGGFTLIALPIILYFIYNSALSDFLFGYFQFNIIYASSSLGFRFDAFANIVARFYRMIKTLNAPFLIILVGLAITLFSKKYIGDKIFKVSLFFSFAFTYMIIASSPEEMGYAYIILFSFTIMGWIYILDILSGYLRFDKMNPILFSTLSFLIILSIGVYNKQFFNMDTDYLLRKKEYSYFQKDFARIINQHENPTLIDLELDNGVFTEANIVPSFKYFFHPFISDQRFSEIKQSEIDIIKNKKSMFVVTMSKDFPFLLENYDVVATYFYYDRGIKIETFLYERKD